MGADASRAARAWAPDLLIAWRAFWLSRLLIWGAGLLGLAVIEESERAGDFDPAGVTEPFGAVGDTLVAPAARWDSMWFLTIAGDGYDEGARAAFFPLYPLLVAAGGFVTRSDVVAGILISSACFVAALAVLHRLARIELGPEAARLAVFATALFPMSFFFSAVYSEAVFLLVSVGAVYAARSGHWALAGVAGALASATRSAGVLLVVPLALIWWRQRPRRAGDAAWIALVPAGLAAFCAALAIDGQDTLAPFDAQETWFREFAGLFGGAWDGAVAAFDGARQLLSGSRSPVYFEHAGGDPFVVGAHNLELFGYLLVAIPAVAGVLRQLPPAYAAYTLAALALPLSWPVGPQPLMSLPRFEAVLFPLFLWLGWWLARGGPWRRRAVLGLFAALLVVSTARFATWHWVA